MILVKVQLWIFFSAGLLAAKDLALEEGKRLYVKHCLFCHGAQGRGDGPNSQFLRSKPMNFTDPVKMKGETDADIFGDIQNGAGTEMPAWKTKLGASQIRAVIRYVRVLEKTGKVKVKRNSSN